MKYIGIQTHKKICEELNDLYSRKNHDYGDSFHETFVEEGFAMPRIRLSDKLNRFKTLTAHTRFTDIFDMVTDDPKVIGESIRDTLLDLANYAIMTIIEMDREDHYILKGDTRDE